MDQDLAVAAMARSDPGPLERIMDPGKIGLAAPEEQAVVRPYRPVWTTRRISSSRSSVGSRRFGRLVLILRVVAEVLMPRFWVSAAHHSDTGTFRLGNGMLVNHYTLAAL
jgi:hypothetical protein